MDSAPAAPHAIDWDFIESLEGFTATGYVPRVDDGGMESGVTIGGGVDLGYWSPEQLHRRAVPGYLIARLRPYLRLTGRAAELAVLHYPLTLSLDDARFLTRRIRADIVEALNSRYRRAAGVGLEQLTHQAQTVIASVAFQYGPALSTRTPKFWRQVTGQDWPAAYRNLLDFGDAYRTRRRREAAKLKEILQ